MYNREIRIIFIINLYIKNKNRYKNVEIFPAVYNKKQVNTRKKYFTTHI